MFPVVWGILTLSCLSLAVLGEPAMLFRVDVTIPTKEGRNETEVDASIDGILNDIKSYGISDHLALKTLDRVKYILVLEVQDICNWHHLTTPLSNLGYELSVTALEKCHDYATRYGVNVTYHHHHENAEITIQKQPLVLTGEMLVDDQGVKGDDYLAMIKTYFEDDLKLLTQPYGEVRCYATPFDIPLRLLYIGSNPPRNTIKLRMLEGTSRLKLSHAQPLRVVTEHCSGK